MYWSVPGVKWTAKCISRRDGRPRSEPRHASEVAPLATPIGLGLALGTAVLPVVAAEAPENLTIVCLDNGAFGSTGNQPTPASGLVDMELLALAAGVRRTCKAQDERELKEAWESRGRGPNFIHVVLKPGNAAVPNIPLTPGEIRER
ncbi:MAG: thiamine pyrophosphate-binding protein, partial [Methanoculleus chikugoensis]|nr:thiamine pyrophosphate-binding protein [Methanoculleus chikugoensis]